MIHIDREKCTRCGACVRDCVVHVLRADADKAPVMRAEDERFCLNCQHCLAVCPHGAVTCQGVGSKDALDPEPLPDGRAMAALVRQRRSIRQWKDEPISEEVWARLIDSLAWMPTGCNDHRLHFTIVRSRKRMDWFRSEMSKALKLIVRSGLLKLFYPNYRRYMDEVMRGDDVIFRNAPYMIVASSPKDAPCREADPWIALSYFDLLAQANGLGTCWSGFAVHAFKWVRRLRLALDLPKGHRVSAILLFGPSSVAYPRVSRPAPMSLRVI
jgi:nitroreductase/NAD-dependent dihydropyrimidine dehydrogenase PreA subunit